MNVEGLTRENVASHLQKYRLYLRRLSSVATQQANMVVALGSRGPSHLRTGSLDGFGDFRSFTGPRRFSSASLPLYQSRGTFGRLNSSAALTLSGISSGVIQPGNSVNGLGKIQPVVLPGNQNQNGALFQGITASIELNQLSQTKSTNHFGEYNCVDERNVFRISSSFPDARVVVGSSSNSLSTASGNALVLQGNTQEVQCSAAFENLPSFGMTSLNRESNDLSVRGSFNCLEHGRCSENWQGTVQLSNFPPSNEQLPSNNLQESIAKGASPFKWLNKETSFVLLLTALFWSIIDPLAETWESTWLYELFRPALQSMSALESPKTAELAIEERAIRLLPLFMKWYL